jgi:glutaredoxin
MWSIRPEETMPRPISVVYRARLVAVTASLAIALFFVAGAPAEAACSKSVVMYNADWCPYCRKVRAILARNDIRYTMLDATTPEVQAVMLKKFGDTAVPRTVIGGVVVAGVDEARILKLCR